MYKEAVKRFDFPEVNGINLGFSSGTHGAGFGPMLREQIIKDAYEIIQSGSEQAHIDDRWVKFYYAIRMGGLFKRRQRKGSRCHESAARTRCSG